MKRCDDLSCVGVIAEFNPLHSGHRYLLNAAAKHGTVVCALSGNFVQRGDTALLEKRIRAKAALQNGADLVLELPVCWSMSTAQNFALGGISLLDYIGCDTVMFGSECGNVDKLYKTADILASDRFGKELSAFTEQGMTFAAAREAAARLCGVPDGILNCPNNTLGVEYIAAAKRIGAAMEFKTVRRAGAAHDSDETENEHLSASVLRERLIHGDFEFASRFIPKNVMSFFGPEDLSDIHRLDRAVPAVLRTKSESELQALPDLSEGIENKLFSAIRLATDLDGLYNMIKTKRYTLARIRRLVLSAFIGIDNSCFMKKPPYLRVLGFTPAGEALLKERSQNCPVPIIARAADIKRLDTSAFKVFETEGRATDLYALSLKKPLECGLEYTSKIIKTEC